MSANPFQRRMSSQRIGDAGRSSEKRLSRKLGGRQTAASGAGMEKGDIALGAFQIECKATRTDTLSIKREWLLKVAREALSAGKTPALTMTFTDDDGKSKAHGEWVAIPLKVFQTLIENHEELL